MMTTNGMPVERRQVGDLQLSWFNGVMRRAEKGELEYDGYRLTMTGLLPKAEPDLPPEPIVKSGREYENWQRACRMLHDDAGVYERSISWRFQPGLPSKVPSPELTRIAEVMISEKQSIGEWQFASTPDLLIEGLFGWGTGWVPIYHKEPGGEWHVVVLYRQDVQRPSLWQRIKAAIRTFRRGDDA